MAKLENKEKKRRALLEGFNNVPKLLEEARRAVDDVTQVVQDKGGGEETPAAPEGRKSGGAGAKRQKAAPREKSAKERGRQKTPSRPPASREQQAVPPSCFGLGHLRQPAAWFGVFRHNSETCYPWAHSLAPPANAARRGPGRKAHVPPGRRTRDCFGGGQHCHRFPAHHF